MYSSANSFYPLSQFKKQFYPSSNTHKFPESHTPLFWNADRVCRMTSVLEEEVPPWVTSGGKKMLIRAHKLLLQNIIYNSHTENSLLLLSHAVVDFGQDCDRDPGWEFSTSTLTHTHLLSTHTLGECHNRVQGTFKAMTRGACALTPTGGLVGFLQ